MEALIDVLLALHVPAEFPSYESIGGEVANALGSELDEQGKVEVYTFGSHIDGLRGSVISPEPKQQAAVLKTQSWNEPNMNHRVDVGRSEQGQVESSEAVVFNAEQAVGKAEVRAQRKVEAAGVSAQQKTEMVGSVVKLGQILLGGLR